MKSRFEDLWASAADDGASAPTGVYPGRPTGEADIEVDHLFDAWNRERTGRIECSLVLDEAHRFIARCLADGEITPLRRRQAMRLIRAIRRVQQGERGEFRP
jgi:hypothetical protein